MVGDPAVPVCPSAKAACDSHTGGIYISTDSMYTTVAPDGQSPAYWCNLKHFLGSVYHYNAKVYPICDAGSSGSAGGSRGCVLDTNKGTNAACTGCGQNKKDDSGNPKSDQTTVANPVSLPSGNKFEVVTDFESAGPNPLRFLRYYSSYFNGAGTLGWSWRSIFSGQLKFPNATTVEVHHANGAILTFNQSGSAWIPVDPDITYRLAPSGANWQVISNSDTVETYDSAGRFTSIQKRSGYTQTLTYNGSGELVDVTDSYGRQLTFTYTNGLIATMTDPDGEAYTFTYDSLYPMPNGNTPILKSVAYPDETPADPNDNPKVTYLYEDTDFAGGLTGIVDERGVRVATFAYDDLGRAILSEHAGGADRHDIAYNVDGSVTVTNPLGRASVYQFATHANAPKVTRIDGQATIQVPADSVAFTYDANGFRASKTDREGNVTNYTRDARGLELSRTEAAGTPAARTIATTWHSGFRLPTQIVAPGKTTDLTYDASGRLTQRTETDTTAHTVPYSTNGQTRSWSYTWSASGLLLSVDGPRTDLTDNTVYTYTPAGALATVTNALSHVTSVTAHNGRGLPLSVTDPNGIVTDLAYDAHGRLTSVTVDPGPNQAVTTMTYDPAGQIVSMALPDGVILSYEYDAAKRLTATENGLGERIEYTVDAMGNRTAETVKGAGSAIQRSQSWVYDELGRLLRHLGAASQQTEYAYDLNGNTVSVTDPLTRVTQNAFDALDRLIKVTDPLLGVTDYAYDAQDNLTDVTDPVGLSTGYVTDGFGRRIQTSSPDTGTTVTDYDPAGNLTSMTDARAVVTDYTYDALNRVLTKTYPADPAQNVSYSYDDSFAGNRGIGRLTGIVDTSGTSALTYDARGNVTKESRTIGGIVYDTLYAFDLADRLTQITYPSGRIVSYTRDDLGRVSTVTTQADAVSPAFVVASRIAYKAFGPVESYVFGNGVAVSLVYDQDGRLTDIDTGSSALSVQDLAYAYDAAGNIVSIADNLALSRTQGLTYDALDRLTLAQGLYGTITYGYDAVGNRTSQSLDDGQTLSSELYTYDAFSNQLLSVTPTLGSTRNLTYTASGQVASDDAGPVAPSDFTYDLSGRLVGVTQSGFPAAAYKHNALGQRVVKDLNTTGTHYHYDRAGQLIAETDDLGNVAREYLQLDGLPLAIIEPGGSGPVSADIVLDNSDPGASGLGPWSSEVEAPDYYGFDYAARAGGDGSGHFDWTPSLPWSGQYQVYARWPAMSAIQGSSAHYTVNHADGASSFTIDQRQGGGAWALLGTFPLSVGAGHGLSLSDAADPGFAPGGSTPAEGGELIVDNADPGASTVGVWTSYAHSAHYNGTHHANYAGTGSETFTWPMPISEAGRYKIYARWSAYTDRATNTPYTITHASGTTTVRVNQEINGGTWNLLGSFDLTPGAGHNVMVSDDANQYAIADAVRFVKSTDPNEPATFVVDNNSAGVTKAGSWWAYAGAPGYYGANFHHSINGGTGSNVLTWPLPITQAGTYEVYARWAAASHYASDAPYTITHASGTTTVRVNQKLNGGQWNLLGSFDLTPGAGHKVSLSDDTDAYPIADAIRFVGSTNPTGSGEFVVDNTDGSASKYGSWWAYAGVSGFLGWNFHHSVNGGTGSNVFNWPAPISQAGTYKVYARWAAASHYASNAPYTVTHAGGSTTVRVNQKLNGGQWNLLGSFDLTPGAGHKVSLSDDADAYTIADSVRFVLDASAAGVEEFIVDNSDGGASAQGAWAGSTVVGGFFGANYHSKAPGTGTDSFTWAAPISQAGRVKVYARWPASASHASNAPYTVTHAGGTHTLTLNQRNTGKTWVFLGSYPMEPGRGHGVTLGDAANGTVVADAVRFVTDTSTGDPGVFPRVVAADAVRFVSNDAEAPLYVHADHLGTPQKMTDQAATLAWDRVAKPFGETVFLTGTATNPQRFPGQLYDPETGFHYNYFRDYDPSIGRYLQSDPIGLAGGLNTYGYVGGNPVRYLDMFGLAVCTCKAVTYGDRNDRGEKICEYRCSCRDNCGNEKTFVMTYSSGTGGSAKCIGQYDNLIMIPPQSSLNSFSFDTESFWDRYNPAYPPPSDFMDAVDDMMNRESE